MPVPFLRPSPPRLSENAALLRAIEDSGTFRNYGPVNTALEQDLIAQMFAGEGACMTVCNATIGLMVAVQQAIRVRPTRRRYALMPSFTFAAAAHAAMWCGLTPLFCDIDPNDWAASAAEEERLLALHGDDIAVVMPYATFGYDIDLTRYEALTACYGVPVVVDAAASLGTVSADGRGFGAGFSGSIVYSMHATKSFSVGEAGLIYSADKNLIAALRQMCNFGVGRPRTATMAGLNAKLSEVTALIARLRLAEYDGVMAHREGLVQSYRQALPELTFQTKRPGRQAHQFAAALLPEALGPRRAEVGAALKDEGIGTATYFSPHLMQQDYFIEQAVSGPLPVTDDIANRMISLPVFDGMTQHDLAEVTAATQRVLRRMTPATRARRFRYRGPASPSYLPASDLPSSRSRIQASGSAGSGEGVMMAGEFGRAAMEQGRTPLDGTPT